MGTKPTPKIFPSTASEETRTSAITPRQKFEGHTGNVRGVIHLPDGLRIITCSLDGSLRSWNLESGKQIGDDWRDGAGGSVETVALSPDGEKVVSGSKDGAVRLWNIDTGKVIAKWIGHTQPVWAVCWSQDSRRVVSGSGDGTIRVWDVESGKTIVGPIETGHAWVCTVVYSPVSSMIATAGSCKAKDEQLIKIWDIITGTLVTTLKGHTRTVECLAWTADAKTLISGSADHSIRTWNTTTWEQVAVLDEHTNSVYDIAISPNGHDILASASYDKTLRLWNLKNSQPVSLPLKHADRVTCVSFSADGRLLAAGCRDKNVYTWDVSAIIREADTQAGDPPSDLLEFVGPNDGDKPLPDVDTTPHPVQQLEEVCQVVPPAVALPDVDNALLHFPQRLQEPVSHEALRPCVTPVEEPSSLSTANQTEAASQGPLQQDTNQGQEELSLAPRPLVATTTLPAAAPPVTTTSLPAAPAATATPSLAPPPDVDDTLGLLHHLWNRLFSRHAPIPRGSKSKKPLYVARVPETGKETKATSQGQPQLDMNQDQVSSSSRSVVMGASDGVMRQAGCCTRFWSCICCASTKSSDGIH
ncbi:quinon protein alcohol dehydrogenase-like superfamily [Suillus paluster]|uniref:quinon protein alcohol dehydrogenase-like superfamily n=1 Tax=Suillus paluster TaxID=48578 RepID=UPI001B87EF4D|nr:quinon protein alcohol dehydrogenase-like superfamily [Suillus paluster]KAG1740187.1 quinon protein alcohol dehydrogenase-like superfamily [Suillus paluster]